MNRRVALHDVGAGRVVAFELTCSDALPFDERRLRSSCADPDDVLAVVGLIGAAKQAARRGAAENDDPVAFARLRSARRGRRACFGKSATYFGRDAAATHARSARCPRRSPRARCGCASAGARGARRSARGGGEREREAATAERGEQRGSRAGCSSTGGLRDGVRALPRRRRAPCDARRDQPQVDAFARARARARSARRSSRRRAASARGPASAGWCSRSCSSATRARRAGSRRARSRTPSRVRARRARRARRAPRPRTSR